VSEPFLGEIKLFSFQKAPTGWSWCNGAIMTIQQNQGLYSLIQTKFGGDGKTTFALPNLQGRTPLGLSYTAPDATRSAYNRDGLNGGSETVTLTNVTVPSHQHLVQGNTGNGNQLVPAGGIPATSVSSTAGSPTNFSIYLPSSAWTANATLAAGTIAPAGGGQGHNNMQPYLVLNFCIATSNAIYPPRK
jgi:microcystin-dependent protein